VTAALLSAQVGAVALLVFGALVIGVIGEVAGWED
jgi:hypothetical protein